MKGTTELCCVAVVAASLAGCGVDRGSDESIGSESQAVSVPSFAMSPAAPEQVGTPVTFDASATVCGAPACTFKWQWFFPRIVGGVFNGWQVGGQMGFGTVITYTFDNFAATKPYVLVSLSVTENLDVPRIPKVYSASTTFTVVP